MTTIETRAYATELRAEPGRTVTGLVAPFGLDTPIYGPGGLRFTERLSSASFVYTGTGGHLYRNHPSGEPNNPADLPVSPCGEYRRGENGLFGRWVINPDAAGDALLADIHARRASALSVGFVSTGDDIWSADRKRVERRGCYLEHVAAVDRGAYPEAQVVEVRADAAKSPYGNDVPYGDPGYLDADGEQVSKSGKPGMKRYPIDAKHVMSAWSYINQDKNASQYTAEQLSAIKGRIRAAMDRHGHHVDHSEGRMTEQRRLVEARRHVPGLPPGGVTPGGASAKVGNWAHGERLLQLRERHLLIEARAQQVREHWERTDSLAGRA